MKPNFIIIGAMKAGTTSLYNYLASHPQISGSKIKETNFFTTDKNFGKGLDWYLSLFDNKMKFAFEASPDYTKRHIYNGVPQRIHSILPDIKLVYILRDPIKRIVSHYTHNFAHGREKRNLNEYIKNITNDDNYLNTSKYYYQIEEYLKYFSAKQILFLEAETLSKNPQLVVNQILHFIGIFEEYSSPIFNQKFHDSSTKRHWTPLERKFNNLISNQSLRKFLKKITNPIRKPMQIPNLTENDYDLLRKELASDIKALREFTELSFDNWSI